MAQGSGNAVAFSFDLFSSISCEMTIDEIIFVFCDARVSCKWETQIPIIQAAHRPETLKGHQDARELGP